MRILVLVVNYFLFSSPCSLAMGDVFLWIYVLQLHTIIVNKMIVGYGLKMMCEKELLNYYRLLFKSFILVERTIRLQRIVIIWNSCPNIFVYTKCSKVLNFQVSRMLPGGTKVIGVYVWVSESTFKNSTMILCQVLYCFSFQLRLYILELKTYVILWWGIGRENRMPRYSLSLCHA